MMAAVTKASTRSAARSLTMTRSTRAWAGILSSAPALLHRAPKSRHPKTKLRPCRPFQIPDQLKLIRRLRWVHSHHNQMTNLTATALDIPFEFFDSGHDQLPDNERARPSQPHS